MDTSYLPGIDVSHFQGAINWPKVAESGQMFAFIKATDGTKFTDPQYSQNSQAARAAGLKVGAYHFLRPGTSPEIQADKFASLIDLQPGDLPPVLDIEINDLLSPDQLTNAVQTWLKEVQDTLSVAPIIYCSASFSDANLKWSAPPDHLLWVAHYGAKTPHIPKPWETWQFWQYSQSGTVAGIQGAVDLDHFAGSLSDLEAICIQ